MNCLFPLTLTALFLGFCSFTFSPDSFIEQEQDILPLTCFDIICYEFQHADLPDAKESAVTLQHKTYIHPSSPFSKHNRATMIGTSLSTEINTKHETDAVPDMTPTSKEMATAVLSAGDSHSKHNSFSVQDCYLQ